MLFGCFPVILCSVNTTPTVYYSLPLPSLLTCYGLGFLVYFNFGALSGVCVCDWFTVCCYFFFFFQAEAGKGEVTGFKTVALPFLSRKRNP